MEIIFRVFSDFPPGLMVAEMLLFRSYPRKNCFWLRSFGTAVLFWLAYAAAAQKYSGSSSLIDLIVRRVLILAVMGGTCLWLAFCFSSTGSERIFCMLVSYAVQNIHHNLFVNLKVLIEYFSGRTFLPWQDAVFSVVLMTAVYGISFGVLFRPLQSSEAGNIEKIGVLTNGAFFLLMTVFFIPELPESFSLIRLLNFCYYLAADCLMLFVLTGLLKESMQSRQLEILEQLLSSDQLRQEISRETIDIINMKCHDLKHQIARIRENTTGDDEFLREAEEAVRIYDSSVNTGNKALDTVLMEKKLYCEKYLIQLTCIADGEKLTFMQPADVYSLFGNALDNAIESVLKEEETEKRVISLSVSERMQLLTIRVENYLAEKPEILNGLPVTTKDDKKHHGFGMKSIQYIARKYGGEISVASEDHAFILNIIIPLGKN